MSQSRSPHKLPPLANLIFLSRWLQLPLYLDLILAQYVYVYHFWVELVDLICAALGNCILRPDHDHHTTNCRYESPLK